jgi:ABC-type Na+ efflux pump permease subunit
MMRSDPGLLPLLEREITVAAHRRRVAIMQLLALLITGAVGVVTAYAKGAFGDAYRQDADPFGRAVVSAVLGALCLVLSFWGPSLTATAVTEERERRTLDLLLCTRLRPVDIVLGKFLGALVQGLLLVVASAPAVAFAAWWGGVTILNVASGYALIILYLMLQLSLGLFSSARAPAARAAFGLAAGMGMMLFVPSATAVGMLGWEFTQGKVDATLLGTLGLGVVVCSWVAGASVLGAVSGVSPVSRDPAPAARKHLLYITVTALITAGALGFLDDNPREKLCAVLLALLTLVLAITALLFLTEDPPARADASVPWLWRAHPLTALLWLLAATLLGVGLVPPLALRGMAAPFITPATCAAFAPFLATCGGIASLTRLLAIRRPARRFVALGVILFCLAAPPLLGLLTGHGQLELAPNWMMLWLHPLTLVLATRPGAVEAATGPFGVPYLAAFVVGHLVLATTTLLLGLGLGKKSLRLE